MPRSIAEIRKANGGLENLTDEDILQSTFQQYKSYYPSLDEYAAEVGYGGAKRGLTGSRISAGIDQYQANLLGLGGAVARGVGAEGAAAAFDQRRVANESAAAYAAQRARDLGGIEDFRDVTGVGSALNYAGGLAAQSLPYAGEAVAGALTGGASLVGTAARVGLGRAAARTAGAVAAGYPSAVGDILSAQREAGGEDLGAAAMGGVPYAALNALGIEGQLARGVRPLVRTEGGVGRRMALGAAEGILGEGLGETGQELINQYAGRMAVNPNETLFNEEANKRYLDSFVGGATLGGLLGGVGGIRGPVDLTKPATEQETKTSTEQEALPRTGTLTGLDTAALMGSPYANANLLGGTYAGSSLVFPSILNQEADLTALAGTAPAATTAAATEVTKPTVPSIFSETDTALNKLGVKPTKNSRGIYDYLVAEGIDPASPEAEPVMNALAASKVGEARKAVGEIIRARSTRGTGVSTVQQPAGGLGVGSPVVQGSVGDAGRAAPVAGAVVGGAPAAGAPLQQTGLLPITAGQPSTPITTTAPAAALGQPSTTGATSGTQASQTIEAAPQGKTTTTRGAAGTTALVDTSDDALEIARATGNASEIEAMREEEAGLRADQLDFTENDLNDLIDEQLGKGKNKERDRKILRAYILSRRMETEGDKGDLVKEIAATFGITEDRVRQIGNPEKLARLAVSKGFDSNQVFDLLGIESAQKKVATKLGKLKGELDRLKKKANPSKADAARMAELDEQITRINDAAESGDMAAAFKEAGIEGEAGEAFGTLDDSREWQKASTAGSQMAVRLVAIADTLAELKATAAELQQLGLAQAEAAATARIEELTAEYEAIMSGYEAKPEAEAAAPKKGKGKGKAAEKATEEKDAAKEAEAAKFRAERAAKLQSDRNGLAVGDTVMNPKLGTGVVKSFAGDGDATTVTVAFQSGQTKELSVKLAKLEKTNAVQVESTTGVSVQPKAETGKEVGRQVRRAPKPATEGKAQVPAVILTQAEQAAQAWDVVAADFPEAPKFADLTKAQQQTFIGFGEGNWERGDVELELTKMARAAAPKVEKAPTPDTTDEQRKTANDLAKDVGGTVVWQEGPLALIRGYSVLSGQPTYAAAIGSSRTRVDVESFTGSAITPEQKARLVKVKKDLEEADAKQHASNPFVKFDANGLATSSNVDPRLAGVIAGWKNLLNLKAKIYVTTIDDARADKDKFTGPHRAVGSAGLDANEAGSMRKMGDGYYIAFTKGTSYLKMLETIAHEMGHVHQREAFDNADPATQKAIRAEHDKFVQANAGKTGKQFVEALRARTTGRSTQLPAGMQASELTPYWKSFSEWYADQVSKWATTSEKPTTVVEKFFSKLGAALKKFYYSLKGAKYLPNETMKQFLDAVADRTIVIDAKSADSSTRSEAMFVGVNSLRTLPKDRADIAKSNLARAKILDAAGESAPDVFMETGWFKGPDGKWRAEVVDKGRASLKQNPSDLEVGKPYDLTDVLDHSELFLRYPALRDLTVVTDDSMEPGNASIDLNKWVLTMSPEESRGSSHLATVLHEVQHTVQELEGFAQGGSPDSVNPFDRKNLVKLATSVFQAKNPDFKYLQQIRELAASDKRQKAADLFDKLQEANQKVYELAAALGVDSSKDSVALEYLKSRTDAGILGSEYNKASTFISFSLADRIRRDMYQLIAGETEAFDTEARLTMSDLDLMTTTPKLAGAGSSTFVLNRATGVYAKVPTKAQVASAVSKLPKQAQQPVTNSINTINDWARQGLDRLVFTSDLIKRAVNVGIKSAAKFESLLAKRSTKARELEREVERVADMYATIEEEHKGDGPNSVNQFIFESTRTGKWGYDKGNFKADPKMAAQFNALKPKAQAYVKAIFTHGDKMLAAKKKAVIDYTTSEYDDRIAAETDSIKKAALVRDKANDLKKFARLFSIREGIPYAPIKRFGDHVVVAKSQAYIDAVAAKDSKLVSRLEKDPDHYHVSFTETKNEARNLAEQLETQGFFKGGTVAFKERSVADKELFGNSDSLGAITRLRAMADAKANAGDKGAAQMQRMVSDLYLQALAEGSARKSEMRRRGVSGEIDMLRSFAAQGRADANFVASVEYNPQVQDAIQAMRKEANEGSGDLNRKSEILNEITRRYESSLDVIPTPNINKLTRLSSVYYLATSPAYYLQNLTQPWMMSVPAMAGRHDYGKTSNALFTAYGQLGGVMKSARYDQQFDFSKVPADVRDAIQELANRGKIDIGLETELGEFKMDGEGAFSKGWNKADKFLRVAVQKVEALNRLSTAMAAYRLELAKTGDKEKAINYADRILTETHGDYSSFNAPRVFNNPIGKVALQFRKFQLIQLTYYAKLLKDAGLNTEEKRAATKALVYSLGHTGLLAGAMGIPGYSAIAWAIGALFGGDDDPLDVTAELRKFIGDEDMANLIMRGAPTLAGVDISGKVGAGNMLSIMPFSNADLTTKAGIIEAAGTLLGGAPVGMIARVADGLGQMLSGEWYKGMEQVLPKGLGDAAKAYRISTEGMSRRNGDIVLPASEVSAWEALVQGMGIQPVQQSVVMERQQNTLEMNQFYQDRSTKVKADYIKAIRAGESTAEARAAWMKLQDARVKNGYTRQPLSELLKAPQSQAKREQQVVGGVQFNKANKRFVEEQI